MSEETVGFGSPAEAAGGVAKMVEMICGYWVTQIVRATAELSLADHVAAGVTTAEGIARREGTDPVTTYRLLRAASSIGLFADAGERRFGSTAMGGLLPKDVPGSLREMAMVQGSPFHWQSWGALPDAVRTGSTRMHAALGMDAGSTAFDYFGQHPQEGALFAASMANATGMVIDDVTGSLELDGVSVAVDVGGSTGALVQELLKKNPSLTGVVLDMPHVVDGAVEAARAAGVLDRFSAVGGDFFEEVPSADLYLLKMILHDWSDAQCLTILRNCRAAAKPGARAAVIESVVGKEGESNFGALMDMNMLAVAHGQERDFDEFDALYAQSGWKRVATRPTRTPQFIQMLEAI